MPLAVVKHRSMAVVLAAPVVLGEAGLWLRNLVGFNVPDRAQRAGSSR